MIKTDEKLVNANIKLVDENKDLKKRMQDAMNILENSGYWCRCSEFGREETLKKLKGEY